MEEDEGWVLPVSRCQSANISQITTYGTHNTVAAPVDNFPFLPPDNRRHEPHRSATTTTPPFQSKLCSISSIDASNHEHTSCALEGYSLPIFCNCPFYCRGTCSTQVSLRRKQSASIPRPTTSRTPSIDEVTPKNPTSEPPQRKPVDLAAIRAEIQANMDELARRFPLPKPTTTTRTTPHPESHPFAPTLSPTAAERPKYEPVDLAAIRQQIRENIEEWNRRFPPSTLKTMTAPPTQQPDASLPPSTRFLATEPELPMTMQKTPQSAGEQSNMPPVAIATLTLTTVASTDLKCPLLPTVATTAPMHSRIERIISQIDDRTTALWTPHAIHRRIYVNRSNGPDTIPARPPEPDIRSQYETAIPKHTDNLRPGKPTTSFFNPAFDIHLPWFDHWKRTLTDHRQHWHQHHSLLANHVTRPYNPAFDIHLMMTDHCQHRHSYQSLRAHHDTRHYNPALDIHPTWPVHRPKHPQNHTCFSVASYVPGLAQNKRPP